MDKRRRARKKTRLPARFGAERPERLGLITDASSQGFYLSTNAVLSKGTVVQVQVKVPGREPLLLQGRVARSRRVASTLVMLASGGMGVQLVDPPAGWREGLALPEDV
ncbi:MAG: PilZ domain-containing protein [Vicinamibacterales bacterium]